MPIDSSSAINRMTNSKSSGSAAGGGANPALNTTFQSIRRDSGSGSTLPSRTQPLVKSTTTLQNQLIRQQKIRDDAERASEDKANGTTAVAAVAAESSLQTPKIRAEFEDASRNIALLEKRLEAAKRLQTMEDNSNRQRSNTFTSIYSGYSGSTTSFDDASSIRNPFSSADVESNTWKLGDILQALGDRERDKDQLLQLSNDLVELLINHPELRDDLVLSSFGSRIQILLTHPVTEVRACGYRISRYILHSEDTLRMLIQLRIEFFLIISLSKDNKALVEKEQAIKLVRQLIELPDGSHTLTIGLVRAIVAIAESADDKLRPICIETLCEISLHACGLVYEADGLKVIFQSFVEGPFALASVCLVTVLKLLEVPESRKYIIDQSNISYFVSSFCDIQTKGHNNIDKLQNNAFMLTILFKTWSGLICLSQENFSAIKDLVNCLAFDIPNMRDILMDIFFDVLQIRTLPWIKGGNIFGSTTQQQQQQTLDPLQQNPQVKTNITPSAPEKQHPFVNHYTALLLMILLRCDLTDKLVLIVTDSNDDLNKRKAIYLLTEIMSLATNLIPAELLQDDLSIHNWLPLLTDSTATDGKIPVAAVFQMARLSGRLGKGRSILSLGSSINRQALETTKKTSYVAQFKLGYRLDDAEFKRMIIDTKILTTKEYEHWNWDLISEMMQGPLLNGKRLEETIRTTKVIKRLMSFYRPFKFRFSKMSSRNKNSSKYVKVGCEIFEMLLHSEEGVRFLGENKLLAQIAECIAQVDPYSGIISTESLFSQVKLETTMSSGYFKMLGVLSKDKNGLKMLEQWKIFSMFYHITEAKRDDLIKAIIRDMDYKIPGHLRIILNKVLTTSKADLRIFATDHLSNLLFENDDTFVIRALMDQLFDSNVKVVETASKIIDDFITDPENLNKVVELKPNLYQLSKLGHTALLKFLATAQGYRYLNDYKIIDKELQEWIEYKIFKYVYDVENLLINDLIQPEFHNNLIFEQGKNAKVAPPQHFFGELVKIDEGVKLLNSSGFIEKISKKIKSRIQVLNASRDTMIDEDEVIQLKGYLWCIGHICSTAAGITLFENRNLIEDIITLTHKSMNFSVKGTCFLVTGLIAKTPEGLEILDELDWCCKINPSNELIGICLPLDLEKFFKLNDNHLIVDNKSKFDHYINVNNLSSIEFSSLNSTDYILMQKVFDSFINLLSHLLTSKAINTLKNMKFKHGAFFNNDKNNLILFKILTKLLMNFKFSKNLRKFLLNDFIDCLYYLKILCKKDRLKNK